MNQEAMDTTSERPDLLHHVARAVEGTKQLQDDVAHLRHELDRANALLATESARNDQLTTMLAHTEALRDHYMRRCVELEISLSTASSVLVEAIASGKGGEYRGNGKLQSTMLEKLRTGAVPQPEVPGLKELARKLAPRPEDKL